MAKCTRTYAGYPVKIPHVIIAYSNCVVKHFDNLGGRRNPLVLLYLQLEL